MATLTHEQSTQLAREKSDRLAKAGDYFGQGYNDYARGFHENPYAAGTVEHGKWERGQQQAFREDR